MILADFGERPLHVVAQGDERLQLVLDGVDLAEDLPQHVHVVGAGDRVVGELLRLHRGRRQVAQVDQHRELQDLGGDRGAHPVVAADQLDIAVAQHAEGQRLHPLLVADVLGQALQHLGRHDARVEILLPDMGVVDLPDLEIVAGGAQPLGAL